MEPLDTLRVTMSMLPEQTQVTLLRAGAGPCLSVSLDARSDCTL